MKSKLLVCIGGILALALIFLAASTEKKSEPAEAARQNNLGCAYMNQQLFEKGLKAFQDAAALDPSLQVAKLNQGIALLSLAKVDAAKAILEEASKADPKDPHVWYALGMLDKNSANPEAAVEDFKHVIAIDDSDADTWYFLGTVYSQLKQFPQAIDAFEHALKLNPLHASAQFGLSRAYQQSADSPHAREHLARFQYITQNKLGSAMSLAYGEQGKYSLAEESPTAPIKVLPQIPVKFVDVTKEAGLPANGSAISSAPACFIDYDNDGKIDLFLVAGGGNGTPVLLHNLGNGKFEDVSRDTNIGAAVGPAGGQIVGCTVGDYDNDGFADLATTNSASVVLLHNENGEKFVDVTQSAGFPPMRSGGSHSIATVSPTFIDYDHDGDLDLLVTTSNTTTVMQSNGKEGVVTAGRPQTWRNNGNGTFTDVSDPVAIDEGMGSIGTDYNNDRAVDIVVSGANPMAFRNQREGAFNPQNLFRESPKQPNQLPVSHEATGIAVLDFDHDDWMDFAFSYQSAPAVELWRNRHDGKPFEEVQFLETNWARAFGIAAFDYDNDGWVDLVAVGETKEGKGEIKLVRNLGPDGWKEVTAEVGLDKIQLKDPRAIITGDYDNDGATDLLITQNRGPAVLLKNEGGNKNNWLRLALKGLNDNKSAIGTKIEVFSDGIRQKYEIYGSNGYLGQNSPYLTVGLGQAKQADVVRMLWPGGVLQDEIEVAANKQAEFTELDRRGSSCPTLFVWDGKRYQLVSDILGAGVVGHWVAPGERNVPRPTELVKIGRNTIEEKVQPAGPQVSQKRRDLGHPNAASFLAEEDKSTGGAPLLAGFARSGKGTGTLSFRLMEPMEEVVYLDAVKLMAVDHPANEDVYPNEYFASNPPYPEFKVVTSRNAKPPAGAWDDKGHDLLPDLIAHKYIGNFDLLPFKGFTKPHSLILDLGKPYRGGQLRLLMHGEIEYFTATGMYAASQAGIEGMAPYVEALVNSGEAGVPARLHGRDARAPKGHNQKWVKVLDDMGFPAGLPKTITVDLSGKLPVGSRRIRITTNLQIYWDNILIDRSAQNHNYTLNLVPLTRADLAFHGYPRQIEGLPPGNVKYHYEQVSRTGPYARQAGEYTRYGDVKPLLNTFDDKLVVFGSGEEVQLEFDPSRLPPLPKGWTRDYFFQANGYEKDMDFYAADGNTVEPLPFRRMGKYPYTGKAFPSDPDHLDYLLKYNTRFVSGNEPRGYAYEFHK